MRARTLHYLRPQRQYRRLLDMYGSLKSQKIGQLEALVEEQDETLTAVREVRRGGVCALRVCATVQVHMCVCVWGGGRTIILTMLALPLPAPPP